MNLNMPTMLLKSQYDGKCVCARHFSYSQFEPNGKLKSTAIPTMRKVSLGLCILRFVDMLFSVLHRKPLINLKDSAKRVRRVAVKIGIER